MAIRELITNAAVRHYKVVTVIMVAVTLGLGVLIPLIRVDTDPENMLPEDEPARLFHHDTKKAFTLSDIVVVGIVNNHDPDGVFNPETLRKVYELTEFAKRDLSWEDQEDPQKVAGVLEVDILAPSTVDNIEQGAGGVVKFEWLMPEPPETREEALAIRDKALALPMLKGTLISEDGKALCLYLPLSSKDLSHKVYTELNKKIATFEGDEEYYITGLPVAEDTFGVEMFIQMAVSAPLAMAVIFILMLLFFRKLVLVISPMIIAMVSVITTMGLLIGLGYPVHIMSSMIPIFLMPIAVVNSVHILSEFFDRYTREKGREKTIREVMGNLFTPMLYTSLTSAAGFASLSLTPIPPVQVFGIFVAVGIMIAWLGTILFVPAYVMMLKEKSLVNFGAAAKGHEDKPTLLARFLVRIGRFTYAGAKGILLGVLVLGVVAVYGITKIEINDNPVKWFSKSHPIRQADIELNSHFGGTYMAYLVLEAQEEEGINAEYLAGLGERLAAKGKELQEEEYSKAVTIAEQAGQMLAEKSSSFENKEKLLDALSAAAEARGDETDDEDVADVWYELGVFFGLEQEGLKVFKQPEVLRWMEGLQERMGEIEADGGSLVGKTNAVTDVVKKVHQELIDGREENYRIPDSSAAVAECLMQFQGSHNPDDLWHLVTPDYQKANIWIQLTSGDNKDMNRVVTAVEEFIEQNPAPVKLEHGWAGLTYINVVWQDKMVWGMLQSFLGSFLVVFIMMSVLFRSPLWGLICMIPLTVTIALIYGVIGLVGKDYDMPVAILSALTLGMAVDFAIHFLERARAAQGQTGSWKNSVGEMFGEPALAITRNVLVIAIGFTPLLAAPLVPYKTVGVLLCAIMAVSGAITLLVLPALLRVGERVLFKTVKAPRGVTCNCGFCIIISIGAALLLALNIHQYAMVGWSTLTWISVLAIPVMALICGVVSRRQACEGVETTD